MCMEKIKMIKDKKYVKVIVLIVAVVWCMIIFFLSHQTSVSSGSSSLEIVKYITEEVANVELELKELKSINVIFRNYMHSLVYLVLSFLISVVCYIYKVNNKYIVAFAFTFLYSITDEIHQYFIPGRAFQLSDILMDLIGNILGILIFISLVKLLKCVIFKRNICYKEIKN